MIRTIYRAMESYFFKFKIELKIWRSENKHHSLPNKLIVSLTSYPKRFNTLFLTLKSLLTQNMRPDLIILWIPHNDRAKLSNRVLGLQQKDVFEIRENSDLGPYNKIIPTLEKFPNDFIVTADDDVYYPSNWLCELVNSWDKNFKHIVAHRIHGIIYKSNGTPDNYNSWTFNQQVNVSRKHSLATGCGGILYPPNCFHKSVLNEELFMKKCEKADDIWLFWMARLNGSELIKSQYHFNIVNWPKSQDSALAHENYSNQKNDIHIMEMIKTFGWPITTNDN